MSIWNRKRFGISQRHRRQLTMQEAYHIRNPDTNQNILWAKRKRFGLKTNIKVFESEDTTEGREVLEIQDNAILDAFANFSVLDPKSNEVLAVLNRHWVHSLVREKWTIRDPRTQDELVTVQARSLLVSLIRNFRWLPILGNLDFFIQFIRLQWDFIDTKSGKKIGLFDRKFTLGDNYILDFEADTGGIIDSRVGLALGIILDTAESR